MPTTTKAAETTAVKNLPIYATKADEIKHLRLLASTVAPDTYLSTLFSEEMLGEMERRIQADGTLDFQADLLGAGRQLAEANARAEAEKQRADGAASKHQADIAFFKGERELAAAEWQREREEWRIAFDRRGQECNEAEARAFAAERDLEAARLEILKLKARLFDMMEAQGK
jgi:hypothetical protein